MLNQKLALPDVTVCAADSVVVDFTARALARCAQQVEFGDAILFSDQQRDGPFRCVRISPLKSIEAYSAFCLRQMEAWIKTPYVLVVQWDGFVINPAAWANAFKKYDYIGAAWHGLFPPGQMVGNGGFSFRSRRLLKAIRNLPLTTAPEDQAICRQYREKLERESGIRFAPTKIADRFAYEYNKLDAAAVPFGFHGVYHLWRHLPEAELKEVVEQIDIVKTPVERLLQLVLNCVDNDRQEAAAILYGRLNARALPIRLRGSLTSLLPEDKVDDTLHTLGRLLQSRA